MYEFFKKMPKVNNRPNGENSPNLVTLYLIELPDHHSIGAGLPLSRQSR
jgi:hypothetical protein